MFWEGITYSPIFDENTTLEDLLENDDILQRCRERSEEFTKFLVKPEHMEKLLELITENPGMVTSKTYYKHPCVAAEILSSEIPQVLDYLVTPTEAAIESCRPNDVEEKSKCQIEASAGDSAVGETAHDINASQQLESKMITIPVTIPLIDKFLTFLDSKQDLNPLTSSFFSKVMISVAANCAEKLIPHLRSRPQFLEQLLLHLDTPAICDFLLELAQQDNGQQHVIVQWLKEANLVPKLLAGLGPVNSNEHQEASAHCLCELISVYRNFVENNAPENWDNDGSSSDAVFTGMPHCDAEADAQMYQGSLAMLDIIESEATLNILFDHMLAGESPSAAVISNCVEVLLVTLSKAKHAGSMQGGAPDELVGPGGLSLGMFSPATAGRNFICNRSPSAAASAVLVERLNIVTQHAISAIIPRLNSLHDLLKHPAEQAYNKMPTTAGMLSPPLGISRLAIVRIVAAFCQLNNAKLTIAIVDAGFVKTLLDLMEAYPHNSFLHQAVEDTLFSILPQSTPEANPSTDATKRNGVQADSFSQLELEDVLKILNDTLLINWILKVSPLGYERPTNSPPDSTAACRYSHVHPKPGFSGHLWRIANSLTAFQNSTPELHTKFASSVSEATWARWNCFVEKDLADINSEQHLDMDEPSVRSEHFISLADLQLRGPGDSSDSKCKVILSQVSAFLHRFSEKSSFSLKPIDPGMRSQAPLGANGLNNRLLDLSMAGGFGNTFDMDVDAEDEDDEDVDEVIDAHIDIEDTLAQTHSRSSLSSSSSDEDEDLQSPMCIRQQANPRDAPPIPTTVCNNTADSNDTAWADFSSFQSIVGANTASKPTEEPHPTAVATSPPNTRYFISC